MIRAEHADRIMQQYESDYDNFLDKLKAKRKAKKAQAAIKKAHADKADKTVTEAEAHKKVHLGQKAKDLLDKAGGIEGAKDTIQNVLKYVKGDGAPADYEVGVGQGDPGPAEKENIRLASYCCLCGWCCDHTCRNLPIDEGKTSCSNFTSTISNSSTINNTNCITTWLSRFHPGSNTLK